MKGRGESSHSYYVTGLRLQPRQLMQVSVCRTVTQEPHDSFHRVAHEPAVKRGTDETQAGLRFSYWKTEAWGEVETFPRVFGSCDLTIPRAGKAPDALSCHRGLMPSVFLWPSVKPDNINT